jgi:hypothetical protein
MNGEFTHDPIKNEWACQLGQLISIRVFLNQSGSTSYSFELKIGDKVLKHPGGAPTVKETFEYALKQCESIIEKSQQDLIQEILKLPPKEQLPYPAGGAALKHFASIRIRVSKKVKPNEA